MRGQWPWPVTSAPPTNCRYGTVLRLLGAVAAARGLGRPLPRVHGAGGPGKFQLACCVLIRTEG